MATAKTTDENSVGLSDFSFDDNVEFFGIKPEGSEDESTIKEVKGTGAKSEDDDDEPLETTSLEDEDKKEKKEDKKEKKEKKEDEPEPTFFEQKDEKEEDGKEEKKDEKKEDEPEDEFYSTLASELKDKGIFQNVEIPKDKKLTEEEFFELQDKEIESRIDETFEVFFGELDEEGKAFLKFKKDGGKTADFLNTYRNSILNIETLDSESEDQRSQVLSHYLTNVEGLDADELRDRLAWLKETGKEKAYAEKYFKTIEAESKKERDALVKAQEANTKKREEATETFNGELSKVITEAESIGAFPLSAADKKDLPSYMTKPTVKVGKSKYVPAFQSEIAKIFRAETDEDKQHLVLLAKLVRNKFDVTDLVTKKKTEIVSKAKDKLKSAKDGVKPTSSGGQGAKSLGEYF